jgi:hypothetical protein
LFFPGRNRISNDENSFGRDVIENRLATLIKSADTDNSGGIAIDELIVAVECFTNLLFPLHGNNQ